MILKLFTQPSCPKCPSAKELVKELRIKNKELSIEEYDVTTVDGLAEASFYTVMATPSILVFDNEGKKVGDWRGEAPKTEEVMKILKIKDKNEK